MRLSQAATQENGDDEQRRAHLVAFARDEMKSFLQDSEWITWVKFAVVISSQFSQIAY
jgi:predicted pyridoxine 5'-phosphate oxidase superfamily flavin-nucleotide-binding protein